MKAIIIDDNKNARIALRSDLEDYCSLVELLGEAEGVQSGIELAKGVKPDLVFLDIRMGDGTGFDFIAHFNQEELPFHIVFTTAYDEYAIKAFKYSAIDYLLKPIDSDSLIQAVSKVEKLLTKAKQEQITYLIEQFNKPEKRTKLTLADNEKIHIVEIDQIISCESFKNYTTFYLEDNREIIVSKPIKMYDELLAENHFLRVHHSHLVNLNQIKEVVKVDGPYLKMKNGKSIPVSTRKKEDLFSKMKELW